MSRTAFISYAHEPATQRAAARLAEKLRDDGVTVWFDQWDLLPGQPWEPALNRALDQASDVLAIVGRSERSRSMLQEELDAAVKANKTIIPILMDDADYADIPESIRDRQAVSLSAGRPAYLQLLRALGKEQPDPDNLDSLTFYQRLRRYLANE